MEVVKNARFGDVEGWKEGKFARRWAGGKVEGKWKNEMGMATLFLKNTPGNYYEQQLISYFPGCGKRARKKRGGLQVERKKERTGEEGKGRKGQERVERGRQVAQSARASARVTESESQSHGMRWPTPAKQGTRWGREGLVRQGREDKSHNQPRPGIHAMDRVLHLDRSKAHYGQCYVIIGTAKKTPAT